LFRNVALDYSRVVVELERSKLFSQLPVHELEALKQIVREQKFAAGREIFKEGDHGDGMYVVNEGLVEISALLNAQGRHVFSKVGPGEMFGEMAVIDQKPRSACATAREETLVYFIPRVELQTLVGRSPALALALLREISLRLREFNRQHVREVLQSERLAIIGRFARSIVHDLKNPLNIISITAELAGMEQATVESRQQAKVRIRRQVERISDLINEILEFTQSTHSDFVPALMDYRAFVEQLTEEIRPEAALKSVKLEFKAPPQNLELLLNPKRLRRVFENLIHNATDAMPEGGRVFIRVLPNQTEVVTEIEDEGGGIAPEIAGQLFEAFATYGKSHGTGLGLSICKRIVEDHHGWIAARNEPHKGAIFSFGLPFPPAHAAASIPVNSMEFSNPAPA
jgi:signal transduction histidine kinase